MATGGPHSEEVSESKRSIKDKEQLMVLPERVYCARCHGAGVVARSTGVTVLGS